MCQVAGMLRLDTCSLLLLKPNTSVSHLVAGCPVGAKWWNSRIKKRPWMREPAGTEFLLGL